MFQAQGSAKSGKAISPADIKLPSATKTSTRQKADKITWGDDSEFCGRKTLNPATKGDKSKMHAVSQHNKYDAKQERPNPK